MTPETALKHQIKDYLDLKGIFHFPILQGLGAAKGIPDRIAVKDGMIYAIEVKAPKGRMSPAQFEFCAKVRRAGGVYVEARSLEDVMTHFENARLTKREEDDVVRL